MVDGSTTVTVSVISGTGQNLPECEMDALLLGRTKVSCNILNDDASGTSKVSLLVSLGFNGYFYDNFQQCFRLSPKMPFTLAVHWWAIKWKPTHFRRSLSSDSNIQ